MDFEKQKINQFENGLKRLEKRPDLKELEKFKNVISKGNFLDLKKESRKVLVNKKEIMFERYYLDEVGYLKIDDEVFVYVLPQSGNYNLILKMNDNLTLNQIKRDDFVVLQIIDEKNDFQKEDCVIFF